MQQDEAERIATQLSRTIPHTVAVLEGIQLNPVSREWEIKVDELGRASGAKGRGILLWIRTPQDWIRLQRYWLKLAHDDTPSNH